jgi:hypothetical protein
VRLVLATLIVLTAPAVAGRSTERGLTSPSQPARPVKVAGLHCSEAGRAIVAAPTGFDGVRVVVADAAPGAAVDVTVLTGASDRRVRARGGGAWSLRMEATAPSGPVLVAIEPSLDAPSGACVERVELLRDERVVADVRVR